MTSLSAADNVERSTLVVEDGQATRYTETASSLLVQTWPADKPEPEWAEWGKQPNVIHFSGEWKGSTP